MNNVNGVCGTSEVKRETNVDANKARWRFSISYLPGTEFASESIIYSLSGADKFAILFANTIYAATF